jgi:hypothetical protein
MNGQIVERCPKCKSQEITSYGEGGGTCDSCGSEFNYCLKCEDTRLIHYVTGSARCNTCNEAIYKDKELITQPLPNRPEIEEETLPNPSNKHIRSTWYDMLMLSGMALLFCPFMFLAILVIDTPPNMAIIIYGLISLIVWVFLLCLLMVIKELHE